MIREGGIQVVDAKTGEDLTRVVLTQIIVEDAKGQPNGLPLELLRAVDHRLRPGRPGIHHVVPEIRLRRL